MDTLKTTARLPFGAITVHQMVTFFHDLADEIRSWNEARQTVAALRRLSPAQLDDIGLTVGDVDAIERRGRL